MIIKVVIPTQIFLEREVKKIIAHAPNGSFCLLPRHIDFVSEIVPGLLSFETLENKEEFLAVGGGTLVKCGAEVLVSTRYAVGGGDIGKLQERVEKQFRVLDEQEKKARTAMARLEWDFIRRFMDLR